MSIQKKKKRTKQSLKSWDQEITRKEALKSVELETIQKTEPTIEDRQLEVEMQIKP